MKEGTLTHEHCTVHWRVEKGGHIRYRDTDPLYRRVEYSRIIGDHSFLSEGEVVSILIEHLDRMKAMNK